MAEKHLREEKVGVLVAVETEAGVRGEDMWTDR